MKEDKYTKSLAKNRVYAIVHMRDIRKNVLPKFIKLCMKAPCLFHVCAPFRNRNICYLCVNSSLEELIKIKVIFILR